MFENLSLLRFESVSFEPIFLVDLCQKMGSWEGRRSTIPTIYVERNSNADCSWLPSSSHETDGELYCSVKQDNVKVVFEGACARRHRVVEV